MARGKKAGKIEETRHAGPWVRYGPPAAVAALVWIIYASTLSAAFVWDDHNLIEMQPERPGLADFGGLWVSDFWQKAQQKSGSQYYRPLTTTTFLLDRLFFGPSPLGYHFTNILIYSACCVLAYLVYKKLLGSWPLALALGLAFAAHPAHTENVAWVSGRTDLVCAALMFAALLAYLAADQSGKRSFWVLSVLLFLLSLFGKEMSITLVAAVAIHQWLRHKSVRTALMRALPFVAAAAFFWALHFMAAPNTPPENIFTSATAYALNVFRNLALGIWHSLVPGGFHYLVTATREQAAVDFPLPSGALLGGMLLLFAGWGAALYRAIKSGNVALGFGLAAGLVSLVPISGLIPIGVIFALRFLLIPSFFFLLAMGALLSQPGSGRFDKVHPAAIMGVLAVVYAAVSMVHAPAWHDDVTLMESVLKKAPDAALAHFLLGNGLAGQGRNLEAIEHYQRAISLRSPYPQAEYNLGVLEQGRGRIREAEKRFRSVLVHQPDYLRARMALVRILEATGRRQEAVRLIREAREPGGK